LSIRFYNVEVTRRGLMVSVIGVAAPIGLLAIAWAADRMFHHGGCVEPRLPARAEAAPAAPEPARRRRDDVFGDIALVCDGPEGVEACAPAAFAEKFEDRLRWWFPSMTKRDDLEGLWLTMLAGGDHVTAYGLAWLDSKRALPELRRQLLADRYFYGWETSTPDPPDNVYADEQYPHHQAYILAIEKISGRPVRDVVMLTHAERAGLRRDAAGCKGWRAAVWLLHEIDGAPLPGTARNRAKRIRCEGAWLPGDPGYSAED
jgi:hypothetical protein